MNQRFLWNFEIDAKHTLKLPEKEYFVENHHQWESRFFWPEKQIITLRGLSDNFLELSHYQLKHRKDTYFLLPNTDYNLKLRHDQLFYKPMLIKNTGAIAYGKKVKLTDPSLAPQLLDFKSTDITALIKHINQHAQKIDVEKEALIYKFKTTPTTKFELARLRVHQKIYFSVSIESPCLSFVESITHQLLGELPSSDYVSFLKDITL